MRGFEVIDARAVFSDVGSLEGLALVLVFLLALQSLLVGGVACRHRVEKRRPAARRVVTALDRAVLLQKRGAEGVDFARVVSDKNPRLFKHREGRPGQRTCTNYKKCFQMSTPLNLAHDKLSLTRS